MVAIFIANRLRDAAEVCPPLVFTLAVMTGVAKAMIYIAG